MSVQATSDFFLWSAAINYALLLWWFLWFVYARGWIRRFHGRWFRLSDEAFDAVHYGGMGLYKLCIIFFNLVPWAALRLIG